MNQSRLETQSRRRDGTGRGVTVFGPVMVWSSLYAIVFAIRQNTAVFVGVFRVFVTLLRARGGRQ